MLVNHWEDKSNSIALFDNISNLFPCEVLRIVYSMNHRIDLFIIFSYYLLFMCLCWMRVDTYSTVTNQWNTFLPYATKNRLVRWSTRWWCVALWCDLTWYDMWDKTIKSQCLIVSFKVSRLLFDKSENKHNHR